MDLTRRDAVAALAATGGAVAVGRAFLDSPSTESAAADAAVPENALASLVAVAEVVYPDAATGVGDFVETYVAGRVADDDARRAGVVETAAALDATARDWFETPLTDLDPETLDGMLRDLRVDVSDPDPDGGLPGRVRFYVVNELLYAFYASPTGGRLVGIENPAGHPGGVESYRQAEMSSETEDDG
ncbi:gluconate 2-dehydrogenase subunit 3 family protein [Haloplanus ruber]|uniref:Gluconate 2-dehydrogenase subunit 3 family protein n=1 Tax=Haloplanus ruber TaxID=869892 RepID=A0ABD6D0F3_9EURY|nr:gluconate 2-dehydrogenase subunit 3 family protein [Haloplanus ruber]